MAYLPRTILKALCVVGLTIVMALMVLTFAAALPFLGALKALQHAGDALAARIKLDARPKA